MMKLVLSSKTCGEYHPYAVVDNFATAWKYIKTVSTINENNIQWKEPSKEYSEDFQELENLLSNKMVDVKIKNDIFKYKLTWVEYLDKWDV